MLTSGSALAPFRQHGYPALAASNAISRSAVGVSLIALVWLVRRRIPARSGSSSPFAPAPGCLRDPGRPARRPDGSTYASGGSAPTSPRSRSGVVRAGAAAPATLPLWRRSWPVALRFGVSTAVQIVVRAGLHVRSRRAAARDQRHRDRLDRLAAESRAWATSSPARHGRLRCEPSRSSSWPSPSGLSTVLLFVGAPSAEARRRLAAGRRAAVRR